MTRYFTLALTVAVLVLALAGETAFSQAGPPNCPGFVSNVVVAYFDYPSFSQGISIFWNGREIAQVPPISTGPIQASFVVNTSGPQTITLTGATPNKVTLSPSCSRQSVALTPATK